MKYLFLILMLLVSVNFVFSQQRTEQKPICFQPFSYQFDNFNYQTEPNIEKRLLEFQQKFNGLSDETNAFIYVYSGKNSRLNEGNIIAAEVAKILNLKYQTSTESNISITVEGYRNQPTVEIFIKPLKCSEFPESSSYFNIEQVEFIDFPANSTIRKNPTELMESLITENKIKCTPISNMLGYCDYDFSIEVFVVIDQKGDVVFSKAMSGQSLIKRIAENTVRNWKFQPTIINDKKFNVIGKLTVKFTTSKSETDGQSNQ